MIAAAMPAAMRPYSIAVAPDSSARNWRSFAIMSRTIRPGSKGFLKMTCDEKKPRRLAGASLYCPRLRHNPERRHDKRQRLAVRFGSSVRAIHGQFRIMSAIAPIATECFGAGKRRYVPRRDIDNEGKSLGVPWPATKKVPLGREGNSVFGVVTVPNAVRCASADQLLAIV